MAELLGTLQNPTPKAPPPGSPPPHGAFCPGPAALSLAGADPGGGGPRRWQCPSSEGAPGGPGQGRGCPRAQGLSGAREEVAGNLGPWELRTRRARVAPTRCWDPWHWADHGGGVPRPWPWPCRVILWVNSRCSGNASAHPDPVCSGAEAGGPAPCERVGARRVVRPAGLSNPQWPWPGMEASGDQSRGPEAARQGPAPTACGRGAS